MNAFRSLQHRTVSGSGCLVRRIEHGSIEHVMAPGLRKRQLVENGYAGLPPKMKRLLTVTSIAATPVVIGALVLRSFLDLWIVVLIVAAIAALLFIPLGLAAAQEKREMRQSRTDDL